MFAIIIFVTPADSYIRTVIYKLLGGGGLLRVNGNILSERCIKLCESGNEPCLRIFTDVWVIIGHLIIMLFVD